MKVLIIGMGSIAQKHIKALRAIDADVELFALRSNRETSSHHRGVENCYDLSEIDFPGIDFVIVANPTALHFESIKRLAQFGKPLFIEKPLFSEVNEATASLVETVMASGTLTYVACNLRFLEALTVLKALLKEERINEVNAYCGSYLPDWRPGVDFRTVYSANKEMGGGVHIDLIHELDYMFWLLGMPQETRSFFSNSSSLKISAFDYANYLWIYPTFAANIVLNYYRKDSKRTVEVITEQNTFAVDLLSNTVYKNGALIFESPQRIADTYQSQMKFFTENVLQQKQLFNTIEEANEVLKLCIQD